MRNQFYVSVLMVALAAASAQASAAEPQAPGKVRPAMYAATRADAAPIQSVGWRRYAYRPYYGGYVNRPYAYRTYRPYYNGGYYNGGYYAQPYNYGGYYGGYYPPYYGGYSYGPGMRYGWRRGGAYYW